MREAIFGAQDGLVSTLAVVSTVSGATNDRFPVLIAGIAAGLTGIFSMAAGEYLSSKSQREIALALQAARAAGDADRGTLLMGEDAGLIDSIEPAGALVERLAADAEAALRERGRLLLKEKKA